MSYRIILPLVVIASLLMIFVGCQRGPSEANGGGANRIVGSETNELVKETNGYIVWTTALTREIRVLSLPELQQRIVRRTATLDAEFQPIVHSLSGPDSDGRIAYVEDHYFGAKEEKHLLKTIKMDGTEDTEIFSRPGDAMWATSAAGHGEIGHYVALAPTGGKVAFISQLKSRQMPRALLHQGQIEVWDIDQKVRKPVQAQAIDEPMSWFPDGKRLAYVNLIPRSNLPERPIGFDRFGKYFGDAWDAVPAIHLLDIETGESTFAHVGWAPVVSQDGRAILVGGWDNESKYSWNNFDLKSQESKAVKWGGEAEVAIGLIGSLVIAEGLNVEVARLNAVSFHTLIKDIDRFANLSFGRGPMK